MKTGSGGVAPPFLTSALEVSDLLYTLTASSPGKDPLVPIG
jgi:hypothetical protein